MHEDEWIIFFAGGSDRLTTTSACEGAPTFSTNHMENIKQLEKQAGPVCNASVYHSWDTLIFREHCLTVFECTMYVFPGNQKLSFNGGLLTKLLFSAAAQ